MTALILLAAIVFPAIANRNEGTPQFVVGVLEPSPKELLDAIEAQGPSLGADVLTQPFVNQAEAEKELSSGSIDIFLVPGKEIVTSVATDPNVDNSINRLVASVSSVARLYTGFAETGISPSQTAIALQYPAPELRGLSPAPTRNAKNASAAGTGMILLFVFLTLYGAFILNGVIEEKTSRVVEILLSTMRTNELLTGKVIGIGIVGSIQGAVLVAVTFSARSLIQSSSQAITPIVLAYTLLWFAIGFGIYSWLYACAGALVSRSEDAENLVFPLQLPLIASYAVGLVASFNGPNPVLNVMSMIPFTAPMTMLERMSAQEVPAWQVAVSIGLCLITMVIVKRLAIVVFAGGILRSGQRVRLKDAWAIARAR